MKKSILIIGLFAIVLSATSFNKATKSDKLTKTTQVETGGRGDGKDMDPGM